MNKRGHFKQYILTGIFYNTIYATYWIVKQFSFYYLPGTKIYIIFAENNINYHQN